ncbi:MAG: DUF2461 domain-containing protein [Clostridia bacterium]|nr:DUF2461 domain-containing protein [Clostridia bacterium]
MFTGFTQATGDFLWGLAMNNDRTWFEAHRLEYEEALNQPFRALARETLEALQKRFPEQDFQVHIARIWRDARRLFGRGPFKDHLWFSIQSGDRHALGPMFWFELSGTGASFGMGNWEDAADVAQHWRGRIDADPRRFEKLVRDLEAQGPFRLYGEPYKRPKADRGERINPWYNRRHISMGYELGYGGMLERPDLPEYLADRFSKLMPLFMFFREVWNEVLTERAGR